MPTILLLVVLLSLSTVAQSLDPSHLKNITVYHVNEAKFGPVPINMDTGDAVGDLFFDMLEVISLPLRCGKNKPPPNPHGPDFCKNQEAAGPDLRVNKLTLEVDSRFSQYAACNVGVNNTNPFGGYCKTDTYCCGCVKPGGGPHHFQPVPCNKTLGHEMVYETMGKFIPGCKANDSVVDCYTDNVFKKLSAQTPGIWYSSLQTGYCGTGAAVGFNGCTWRVVSVDKIVKRACHTQVFGAAVGATAPACFERCGDQKNNVTAPCWADCFYKAALGPDSGKPGGVVAGMSTTALEEAWVKPFLPEKEGGCPPAPPIV